MIIFSKNKGEKIMSKRSRLERSGQKQEYWVREISKWEKAGKSQAEYCREYRLNLKIFGYWKRKIKKVPTVSFVQIPSILPSPVTSKQAPIVLSIDNFDIKIGDGFNSDTLKRLVQTLGGL
jgi:hypothetical protein